MEENLFEANLRIQRDYFARGATRPLEYRLELLEKLRQALLRNEANIFEALRLDLGKSAFESYATELGMVLEELKLFQRKLKKWARPQRAAIAMSNLPASGQIVAEPYGHVLIFSAWNYPLQLALNPMIAAVAAGNCVMLKLSEVSPATAELLHRLIGEVFPPEFVQVCQGGPAVGEALLRKKFDLIFFTGSSQLGHLVYRAAAVNMTPVVLELGGKTPCIVDADADLKVSARRIAWGKFLNAGQTCVAPDYLLLNRKIKNEFLALLAAQVKTFFGDDPQQSPDYPRVVNERHFDRLTALLNGGGTPFIGGQTDREKRYIAPTILTGTSAEAAIMQEEIFGPLLPVIEIDSLDEAIEFINRREKPLALYYFSSNRRKWQELVDRTSSGGVAINETITHFANPSMPFGGIGNSGIGAYHGRHSFTVFSHLKPVMTKPFFPDLPLRYPPYGKRLSLLRWLIG